MEVSNWPNGVALLGIVATLKEVLPTGIARASPNFELVGAAEPFVPPPIVKVGNTAGATAKDEALRGGKVCLKTSFEKSRVECDFNAACAALVTGAGEPKEHSVLVSGCDSDFSGKLLATVIEPGAAGGSTI